MEKSKKKTVRFSGYIEIYIGAQPTRVIIIEPVKDVAPGLENGLLFGAAVQKNSLFTLPIERKSYGLR